MFEGFARVWTPLVAARKLGRKPLRLILAGEPVALFRSSEGRIGALIDRCPHRGVALSLGQVTRDGCLACAFHGWRFDADGANQLVPLNPEVRRERLGATALPVRAIGDWIWIYTSPSAAPPEPVAPEGLTAPGLARISIEREWDCHWTRAMENMLDAAHLPFVHRRTIGRAYRRRITPASSVEITWEDTEFGGRTRANLDGVFNPGFLEFFRPNIMALNIAIPGRHLRIHALVVPAEAGRTRLTIVGSRDFLRTPLMNPWFRFVNGLIADEDRAVVESSGREETPPPGAERSAPTDRATLQFRRYYYDTLRASSAAIPDAQSA